MILHATARFTPRGTGGQFIALRITPALVAAVEVAAQTILDEALAIVPRDTEALADSGMVTDSVQTATTVSASVIFSSPHAAYVEYGTGKRGAASPGAGPYPYKPDWPGMVAQPYLRPAIDAAKGQIVPRFAEQIKIAIGLI
jgi:HK97 gp10 family phage protein